MWHLHLQLHQVHRLHPLAAAGLHAGVLAVCGAELHGCCTDVYTTTPFLYTIYSYRAIL